MALRSSGVRGAAVGVAVGVVLTGLLPVGADAVVGRSVRAHDASEWDVLPQRQTIGAAQTFRSTPIKDRYIVTFRTGTQKAQIQASRVAVEKGGGQAYRTYSSSVRGFAAELNAAALSALRRDPGVAAIEADRTISVSTTQSDPPNWGLDRIDQPALPLNNAYDYEHTGAGVTAYIIDTGVRSSHLDLAGRVDPGFAGVDDGNGTEDCNGHGTHVSGILAGTVFGVAKQARVVPVRVLGCDGSGSVSAVIAGVDWVTANHKGPSVANMSLGGVSSQTLDAAVASSIAAGVHYVVAAGNEGEAACTYSPGRLPEVLAIGATTRADARASFSNFGPCVDLFAPGEDILSAYGSGDRHASRLSGTSMAAPHVGGVLAQYLQTNPTATPAAAQAAIIAATTLNLLSDVGPGSPNRMLFSLLANRSPVGVGPQVGAPRIRLGRVAPEDSGEMTVQVEVPAPPTGGRTQMQHNRGRAGWVDVPLPDPRARSVALTLAPGPVTVRTRTIDARGIAGPWRIGVSPTASVVSNAASTIYLPAGAWSDAGGASAPARAVVASSVPAARATFTFTGTQFAWISERPASMGRAAIFIDGAPVATVDLSRLPRTGARVAFVSALLAPGSHTVVLEVLGASDPASVNRGVDVSRWWTLR